MLRSSFPEAITSRHLSPLPAPRILGQGLCFAKERKDIAQKMLLRASLPGGHHRQAPQPAVRYPWQRLCLFPLELRWPGRAPAGVETLHKQGVEDGFPRGPGTLALLAGASEVAMHDIIYALIEVCYPEDRACSPLHLNPRLLNETVQDSRGGHCLITRAPHTWAFG